jgi:aldose 1-epimerase
VDKLQEISIQNANGMLLKVINFGATITALFVPDKNNKLIDVIVGLKSAEDYIGEPYSKVSLYLGSSIGRYAGRISKGSFKVDGITYPIKHNDGVHLHGHEGFDMQYWEINKIEKNSVTLSYYSKHLENGYPGNLDVSVTYELTDKNILRIIYLATTDKATPVNLTSHPYINLNGKGTVLDHLLMINSKEYLEVDNQLLPTGKILSAKNTPFDRREKVILRDKNFTGFDDTFILKKNNMNASLAARESGIHLNVFSKQPAMVVYTPKKFPSLPFKDSSHLQDFPAICFEPQNFPNSPNYDHFPNSILKVGETYKNEILYEFSAY